MGFGLDVPGMPGGGIGNPLTAAASAASNVGETLWNNLQMRENATASRNWSASMANTAHQREVRDLVAAGLNPILSAGTGGNPSPMAPVAQVSPLANTASSAMQLKMAMDQNNADLKLKDSQTAANEATARNADASADLNGYKQTSELLGWDLLNAQIEQAKANARTSNANATGIEYDNTQRQQTSDFLEQHDSINKVRILSSVLGVNLGDVLRLIKPSAQFNKTYNNYPSTVISPSSPSR